MNNPRVSLKLVALTALVALSAGSAALSAQGSGNASDGKEFISDGEEFIFGTVGITASQTARLNVVNTGTDGPAQTRVLKFLDAAGNLIVTNTVTLAPGESAYLDLDGAAIAGSGRVQIRALDPTCPTCRPFGIIQTLELIDTVTGRTDILYAPAQFLRPDAYPNSPEPFGMVGVIGGQTARLNVTAPPSPISPPNPVRVSLGFFRSDGQPIIIPSDFPGPTKSFTLQPGESVSLDLVADSVLADGETRAEIRPVVRHEGPPTRIIPTFEVIDSTTRKTAVLYAPATRACGSN